jgi:hypothetical protein
MTLITLRSLPLTVGFLAWIAERPNAEPPGDLAAGQSVVIARRESPDRLLVRTRDGKEVFVSRSDLDAGYEFLLPNGNWRHECDPAVLAELQRVLRKADLEGRQRDGYYRLIERVIARNRGRMEALNYWQAPLTGGGLACYDTEKRIE